MQIPPKRGTYGQGYLLDAGKQGLKPLLATRLADGRDHALRAWKIERFGHAEHGGRSNEKPKRHALKERSRNSKGEQCGSYGGCTHGDMLAASSVGYHPPEVAGFLEGPRGTRRVRRLTPGQKPQCNTTQAQYRKVGLLPPRCHVHTDTGARLAIGAHFDVCPGENGFSNAVVSFQLESQQEILYKLFCHLPGSESRAFLIGIIVLATE